MHIYVHTCTLLTQYRVTHKKIISHCEIKGATILCVYLPNASCNFQNSFAIRLSSEYIVCTIKNHNHPINMSLQHLVKYLTAEIVAHKSAVFCTIQ